MTAPVARLSAPADLVAVVPHLIGFVPTESVVLLALRGPRRRVRVTLRLDVPRPRDADRVAASLVDKVRVVRADAVVALVYTDEPGQRARQDLADALVRHCGEAGLELTEALLVRGGRFWSYTCSGPCCPPEGTPLLREASGPVGLVQAETALAGRAVLADRDALHASLAPADDPALTAAFRKAEGGWPRSGVDRAALLREALAASPRLLPHPPAEAARLALALHDVLVRDEVATWSLDDAERLLALLHQLARQTPPPWDAPVCTLLAWTAYASGDGSTANVALERALATDPDYSLALLLRTALDRMVQPAEIRDLLRAAAERLVTVADGGTS